MIAPTSSDLIPATDLKQWAYCPRIVFYHRVHGIFPPPTRKMAEALNAQDLFEKLELRRALDKYGLTGATRQFGVFLTSSRLGLTGKIDLLVSNAERAAIVDFKLTAGDPGQNHRLQLAVYGMLAEEHFDKPVPIVFLYRIPDDRLFPMELNEELRDMVRHSIASMKSVAASGACPPATSVRARCAECEFANFCGDVF